MNGYEFVARTLRLTDNDVGPLIQLSGGYETEWIEFKAATLPEGGRFKEDENEGDYRWHVAVALIAMANSTGGAVVIGVRETKDPALPTGPVDLAASGFNGDKDDFARKLQEQIIRPANGWKTKHRGTWTYGTLPDIFAIDWGTYCGSPVAIIFVKPIEEGGKKLWLQHARNNQARHVLQTRAQGQVGKNEEVTNPEEAEDWWQARRIDRPALDALFHSFEKGWVEHQERVRLDAELEAAIAGYARLAVAGIKTNELDALFTPLEGETQTDLAFKRELFEPQAEENFNPWDDDDPHRNAYRSGMEADSDYNVEGFFGTGGESSAIVEELPARAPRSGGVFDLLAENQQSVLLGEPGSGKTWCLQYLQLEWALNRKAGGLLTIHVPLSRFLGDLWAHCARLTALSVAQLHSLADHGRLCLLLDALNECPPRYLDACKEQISQLRDGYSHVRVILASRLQGYDGCLRAPAYVIKAMSPDIQIRFLGKRLGSEERAGEVLEQLRRQPGGQAMISNPFLLRLVAEVVAENDADLPYFAAELHRHFFDMWYRREAIKAAKTDTSPPSPNSECRDVLAMLAFRSRVDGHLAGFSLEWAMPIAAGTLGAKAEQFLRWIAQGLLFSLEDDDCYLRFRHETLQESLAAEYLVAHPEAWNEAVGSAADWKMTAAHALSLMPEGDRGDIAGLLARTDSRDPWLRNALGMTSGPFELPKNFFDLKRWFDPAVRIGFAVAVRDSRLRAAFLRHVWYPNQAAFFVSEHLLARSDFAENLRTWVSYASPIMAAAWVREGLMLPADFSPRLKTWIAHATPREAAVLVDAGILTRDSFADRLQEWTKDAPPEKLSILAGLGWIDSDGFSPHQEECISRASAWQAASLVNSGLLSRDDYTLRRGEWAAAASPSQAAIWMENGLLTAEDLAPRIPDLVRQASPWQGISLIRCGLLRREDFSSRTGQWTATASLPEAITWIQEGLSAPEDFSSRAREWVAEVTPSIVSDLIETGLAENEALAPGILGALNRDADNETLHFIRNNKTARDYLNSSISQIAPQLAIRLVDYGLMTRDDFRSRYANWIAQASLEQALEMVRSGLVKAEEFSGSLAGLLAGASTKVLRSLMAAGLIGSEDVKSIAAANAPRLEDWIRTGLLTAADLLSIRSDLARALTLRQAIRFVRQGFLTLDDFSSRLRALAISCTPDDAMVLIAAGWMRREDFSSQHAEWMANVPFAQVVRFVESGLIDKEILTSRASWISR